MMGKEFKTEASPLEAEAMLKQLATGVWQAGAGRLSVEVCVDEAIRLAKERFGMVTPEGWRDRLVEGAKKVLETRKSVAVQVIDASEREFVQEMAKFDISSKRGRS